MRLTNIVYSANIRCTIDLQMLCQRVENARYHPQRFPALIWKDSHFGGNCLVFSNGKINCNGRAATFREGRRRLKQYARRLLHFYPHGKLTDVKRLTASACHELSGSLILDNLAREAKASFHPEIFPALVLKKEGVTFSCFHSGKIIITGIKRTKDLDRIVYPTIIELELYTT
ncbi:MAG: hypothetical protein ABW092_16080 [Candidatus Thiodiazotropha sp.]